MSQTEAQKKLPKIGTQVTFYPAAKEVHSGFAYFQAGQGSEEAEKVGCLAFVAFPTKNGNLNLQVIDHGGRAWTMQDVPWIENPEEEGSQPLTGFATKFVDEFSTDVQDSSGNPIGEQAEGKPSGMMKLGEDPMSLKNAADAAETKDGEETKQKEGSALGTGFGIGEKPQESETLSERK